MADNREELQRRISLLKVKIRTTLKFARGVGISAKTFHAQQRSVTELMTEIEVLVNKIQLLSSSTEEWEEVEEESQTFLLEFRQELECLEDKFPLVETSSRHHSSVAWSPGAIRDPSSFIVKPPQIQITGPTFSGLEMHTDRMSFRTFLSRFENCVVGMANDAERLNFLKCSLSDRPLLLINHLNISDMNYRVALSILKSEYLDEDEIVDGIFQDILDFSVKRDRTFSALTEFITRTASLLAELESSFGCAFSDDRSSGARLMAKLLFMRFPREVKGELIQLSGRRIPILSCILRDTREAVKRLLIKGGGIADLPPYTAKDAQSGYKPNPARKDSSFHINSAVHTGSGGCSHLPPIVYVAFSRNGKTISANCLLDTGSGRTYLSGKLLGPLGDLETDGVDCELKLSTLLGDCNRQFREIVLVTRVGLDCPVSLPVLVDSEIDLSVRIRNLDALLDGFQRSNIPLAGKFERGSDVVRIDGIIGLDLIQHLEPLQLVSCMQGRAFSLPTGLAPFGGVGLFSLPAHTRNCDSKCLEYHSVLDRTAPVKSSHLCFVLESEASYMDPLRDFFPDSEVQRGLERMFSMESLGIAEQEEFSDYDQKMVDRFCKSISFQNNKYYVQLPWDEDKLSRVPSNHAVALRVLDNVVQRLEKKMLLEDYLKVFQQQERDGIIEEIFVPPQQFQNYIWIPHRPVLKLDPTSTTRIRPVFNCSLKTNGCPSLNEAAYPGINLTGNMLDLLLSFRANHHVLLADIRKAFLMIRLELEADKNRFCFFMKDGDRLRCYRYTTIIFGFTSSPFILSCIMQYHAAQFPPDPCRHMMESRFYVDNLVMTSDHPGELCHLYTLSRDRLQQGGFELQSCSSNCEELRVKMNQDDTLTKHGIGWEKVLGYRYCPLSDRLYVAPGTCNPDACTKRQILAEAARIFDPLSLCLPVTLQGRILISELWKAGYGWDEKLPQEFKLRWKNLSADLSGLGTVFFSREAFSEGLTGELFLFCDASPGAYGFAVYAMQNRKSQLIFAKAKVAPLKSKSLPTLELLAVYLALKCLPTVLKGCGRFSPAGISIATDSQVVLSWILSRSIASKNIFARNRLKDVLQMSMELEACTGLTPSFRYVLSSQNPADLITRGMTLDKFKSCLQFWCEGPTWLSGGKPPWHTQELPCLNRHSQRIARSPLNASIIREEEYLTIIPFKRFSSFSRLLRVTSLVFRFINKLRRLEDDGKEQAAIYLLKGMQQHAYADELEALQASSGRPMPRLVDNLDLFIDDKGLIRSGGRIGRSLHFSMEVKHPILIARHHPITNLMIMDAHVRCLHLGVGSTLAELRRSGYWVPKGRQAVKAVLASCTLCRKYNARQVLPPNVANLPTSRVELEVPFKHTGIDFTGHLWIKEGNGERKVYLLLFTCLSIRAVHVEVVPNMSVLSFLQALIRFTNLYGIPAVICSDNAKTFLGGGRLFSRLVLCDEFQRKFGSCHIQFRPIPLFSPWIGGAWERNIQTIKTCLHKVVGRGEVDYFSLLTIVSDIQRAVNNRPLSYRESAERELEAVTPNMFLRPNRNPGLLLTLNDDDFASSMPPSREKLLRTMRMRNHCLERFRELWYNEYLLSLRERPQGRSRVPFQNRLKVDDVVLIKSPLKPRPFWVLGSITELLRGKDDVIRMAKVRQGDGAVLVHSLKHLYPLELSLSSDNEEPARTDTSSVREESSIHVQSSPADEERLVWLCPTCGSPQGDQEMICCDQCDDWYHFKCVGIHVSPPARQKWYCPDCAPGKKRRGRPSLLPE